MILIYIKFSLVNNKMRNLCWRPRKDQKLFWTCWANHGIQKRRKLWLLVCSALPDLCSLALIGNNWQCISVRFIDHFKDSSTRLLQGIIMWEWQLCGYMTFFHCAEHKALVCLCSFLLHPSILNNNKSSCCILRLYQ